MLKRTTITSPSFYLPTLGLLLFLTFLLLTFPLAVNPNLDFSQFYIDLFGILHGDPMYDHGAHSERYAAASGSKPVILNPPAYPPWYYILFLPLGALDPQLSARMWGWCNLAMFGGAALLLTGNVPTRTRALFFGSCFFFAPLIGHIVIGQQTIIVLLGLSLSLTGLERRSSTLTAIGLLLQTFKPHLGIPLVAAFMYWLGTRHRTFAYKTFTRFIIGIGLFVLLTLIFDHRALVDYPSSLLKLSSLSINQVCDSCSSLALIIHDRVFSSATMLWMGRFTTGIFVAIGLFIPLCRARLNDNTSIAASTCIILLAAPYIRSYDYVLLIAPLLTIAQHELPKWRADYIDRLSRQLIWIVGFFIAGILPLFTGRQSHTQFLWVSAACIYVACFYSHSVGGRRDHDRDIPRGDKGSHR